MPLRSNEYTPPARWPAPEAYHGGSYGNGHVNGNGYYPPQTAYEDYYDGEPVESIGQPLMAAIVSALLPGIGHAMAGHRRTGRVMFTAMLILVATIGIAYVGLGRSGIAGLAVDVEVLSVIFMGTIVLGFAWAAAIVSAFLINKPDYMTSGQRAGASAVISVLCLLVLIPAVLAAYYTNLQRDTIGSIFTSGADAKPNFFADKPRVNILLLGSDAAEGRDSVRTDTVMVASIDTMTGRTVQFSLPRNLQNVPFPNGTRADQAFPNGFTGEPVDNYLLNAIYRHGLEHPDLVPDASNPGVALLEQGVEAALDVEIDYYIIIDLKGFEGIVDALGGVKVVVQPEGNPPRPIPIGGQRNPDGSVKKAPSGELPLGNVELDGYQALWYARSRFYSDDYHRMARQQCVLGAIARQATPANVLLGYQELAKTATNSVETDIPEEAFQSLVELAAKGGTAKITGVSFDNKVIKASEPDYGEIRAIVRNAINEAIEDAKPTETPAPSGDPSAAAMSLAGYSADLRTQATDEAEGEPEPGDAISIDEVCEYW